MKYALKYFYKFYKIFKMKFLNLIILKETGPRNATIVCKTDCNLASLNNHIF